MRQQLAAAEEAHVSTAPCVEAEAAMLDLRAELVHLAFTGLVPSSLLARLDLALDLQEKAHREVQRLN